MCRSMAESISSPQPSLPPSFHTLLQDAMFRMTSLLLRKCPRFKDIAASHPALGQRILLDMENRTEKALAFIRYSKGSQTDSVGASLSALRQLQEAPPQPGWTAISKDDWVRPKIVPQTTELRAPPLLPPTPIVPARTKETNIAEICLETLF